ncbi:hypothetical protein [Natronoglomus mannanivorans]|uniref:Tail assembly chaperone n=1 Tax=Natronoglomus mannanivorans TaxID=2979990 RepID=A0AAP2Z1E6_9EURY|nr:hypothetical protein [Halobacteria archaeon AArc-xg1-1]
MSDDTDMTDDVDEQQTATWADVKEQENKKRQATKSFVLEYPNGLEAVFEYEMVENLGEIARRHTSERPTRTGQEPQRDMTEDDEWAFAADLFREAIVGAPDGFKPTEKEIREGLTKPVVDEMIEAISNFSTMDEETFIKFR